MFLQFVQQGLKQFGNLCVAMNGHGEYQKVELPKTRFQFFAFFIGEAIPTLLALAFVGILFLVI